MAWTTPITFVANAVLTAAQLNVVNANLNALYAGDGAGWTSYTPTIVGTASPTLNCRYNRTGGKMVTVEYGITFTAGASAQITMSLPSTAAASDNTPLGTTRLFDTSTADVRFGHAFVTSGLVNFTVQTSATAWAAAAVGAPWTWASGDTIRGTLTYRES